MGKSIIERERIAEIAKAAIKFITEKTRMGKPKEFRDVMNAIEDIYEYQYWQGIHE